MSSWRMRESIRESARMRPNVTKAVQHATQLLPRGDRVSIRIGPGSHVHFFAMCTFQEGGEVAYYKHSPFGTLFEKGRSSNFASKNTFQDYGSQLVDP
mmetsp:Transcript_121977/g.390023  ORF Transcript_121977/g.390023 Transcript_121977/m.390023 type:complete len:98 (-) Transcript_121977:76-369(-)